MLYLAFVLFSTQLSIAQETWFAEGRASFYADLLHGNKTSSGESYNTKDFTAAHKTLPFNTYVLVNRIDTDKSVVVRINDRGPHIKARIIDLSKASAKMLDMVPFGTVRVRLKILDYLEAISPDNYGPFEPGNLYDIYGAPSPTNGLTINLWDTHDLVHLMYMTNLLIQKIDKDQLRIRSYNSNEKIRFTLLYTNIEDADSMNKLITNFKKSGFSGSQIYSEP